MMNGLALVRNRKRKKMIIRCFPWGLEEDDDVSDEIEKGDH